jgi:alpha-beta hydrolase superfamily lysophospholipase
MAIFVKTAPSAKMLRVPGAYHELLMEKEPIKKAVYKVITDFFEQKTDDVADIAPM